jgi:hypothetical protein
MPTRSPSNFGRHTEDARIQNLARRLIDPTIAANDGGAIQCRERLGGLLRSYQREAA